MSVLAFFQFFNDQILALPSTILFFATAIYLTLKTNFLQVRSFGYFLKMMTQGVKQKTSKNESSMKTIGSFQALYTAMATTIGMGNVVSPSLAIIAGGPGALFWLVMYMFFAGVTRFTEVVFALKARKKLPDGYILGGPMQYLSEISPFLSLWYSMVMVVLFAGWSSAQSNTLANIFALEGVPRWVTGTILASFVFVSLIGGAKRIGQMMSKLVPIMFLLYISFALYILFSSPSDLYYAIAIMFKSVLKPEAAFGGVLGGTIFQALRFGAYRGIFISEAGVGTSSIPHSLADTERHIDQGILAMGSIAADAILSLLSGLLILVTGVWAIGSFRSTLIYEAFKLYAGSLGSVVLLISVTLFVVTTVIGNSFNGTRCFGWLSSHRWEMVYIIFTVSMVFLGSQISMRLMWECMDTLLVLVAIPNLIGILYLAHRHPEVMSWKRNN